MDILELFGKQIPIRTHYCSLFGKTPHPVEEPYISIYVRYKGCNARCNFCIWYDDANPFDESKWEKVLTETISKIRVKKIAFSGGEPTMNWKRFKRVLKLTKDISPNTSIVVNTDGLHLKRLFEDESIELINSVSLSRHHYNDEINNQIFKCKTPSSDTIREVQRLSSNKDILHLSCNLIKGYIDNKDEIFKYFEFVNTVEVNSTGIISLMPVNDYAKDNFIDFKIKDLICDRFNLTKQWEYKDMCRCNNYVYLPEDLRTPIKVYHKNTYKPFDIKDGLTFDGQNLKQGFVGDIIV